MADFENKGFEPEENKEETRKVESEQHQIGIPNGNSVSIEKNEDIPEIKQETRNAAEQRGQWNNQCEFLLSAVGYAVGLGNVWRFPYLAYTNGGGSFLIPYLIMLFLAGLPLFFMELAIGQYSGLGPIKVFRRMAPIFQGLGFGMVAVTFFVCIYYNIIIAWTLFYMVAGFTTSELPWSTCTNSSTVHCFMGNITEEVLENDKYVVGPVEDYYNHELLGLEKGFHDWREVGSFQWKLIVCLFSAWTIVCLCLIKGVQSSGKVVYFTALFPFVVLIILFIFGMTLEGAVDGILFYVTPDFDKLKHIDVWSAAANQIFYSLGPAFGGLITLSSYNRFDNNCHRDAILIAFINCGTSVFAGFVVFSILGFMAWSAGKPVEDVITSGPGLAFIAYPDAVSEMPVPQLWSFLFFFMLILLGLDSMFTFVETLTTAILDHFNHLHRYKHYVVIGVCSIGFLSGLSMCTNAGIFMFELLDNTCASWNILLFAILELVVVSWIYGVRRFMKNIEEMDIHIPWLMKCYWMACWTIVTPVLLISLIVISFIRWEPLSSLDYKTFQGEEILYTWPESIQVLGWLVPFSSVAFLPALAIHQIISYYKKNGKLSFELFKPTAEWKSVEDKKIEIRFG